VAAAAVEPDSLLEVYRSAATAAAVAAAVAAVVAAAGCVTGRS
jgi:hypothetical protein